MSDILLMAFPCQSLQVWRISTFASDIWEQTKSSDIEQPPPFGDRKKKINTLPQMRGGGTKTTGTSYNFDKGLSGVPDGHLGKLFLIRDAYNFD